jgi:hypothetical protein
MQINNNILAIYKMTYGQLWYGPSGFLYKKAYGAGSSKTPASLISCNQKTYLYNKYNAGNSGIGATSRSVMRAKNRLATVCTAQHPCHKIYNQLGVYN